MFCAMGPPITPSPMNPTFMFFPLEKSNCVAEVLGIHFTSSAPRKDEDQEEWAIARAPTLLASSRSPRLQALVFGDCQVRSAHCCICHTGRPRRSLASVLVNSASGGLLPIFSYASLTSGAVRSNVPLTCAQVRGWSMTLLS